MKLHDGPGALDVLVTILSPVIVAGLVVIYLLGWWVQGVWRVWRWVRGERI
jgi:hypothetical protein